MGMRRKSMSGASSVMSSSVWHRASHSGFCVSNASTPAAISSAAVQTVSPASGRGRGRSFSGSTAITAGAGAGLASLPAARRLAAVLRASTCAGTGASPPSSVKMLRLMVLSP